MRQTVVRPGNKNAVTIDAYNYPTKKTPLDELHAQATQDFIREYLREDWTPILEEHYLIYTALIAWYWFVWALYRESCGAAMGESLGNWLKMAEYYSE